jgi:hypothetical protein
MLTSEAAGLAIKIAKGLIKTASRIDVMLAEKEAVQGPLALPLAQVNLPPTQPRMLRALRALLKDTEDKDPDPLAGDRDEIRDTVENHPQQRVRLFEFMQRYLPEQALGRQLDLNSEFLTALRDARPDLAADPDLLITAFYVSSGSDYRSKDYNWRIALTIVDILAEFGAENMSLFTRNEELQAVAGAVLQRFATADVQNADSTQVLLRAALSATLNGALDARSGYGTRNPWIGSILDALLVSRETLPAEQQDNFIAGLLQGNGYPLLVATVLDMGAGKLDSDDADAFKLVAADVLGEVAGIISQKPGFENFFNDHWGNILRAGLTSVQHHGPALMNSDSRLLSEVLVAIASNLSTRSNNKQLPESLVLGITNAAIASVATDPALIDAAADKPWLSTLISSIATTMTNKGIRSSFSKQGLEQLLKDTLGTFANHPELIIENPGLARDLTQGILKSVNGSGSLAAEKLASAAIEGALPVITSHPALIDFKYPQFLATFAGKTAILVKDGQLSRIQASDILRGLGASLTENPTLFLSSEKRLAEWVLHAVVQLMDNEQGKLLAGTTLVSVVDQVMYAQARSGRAALKNHPATSLKDQLADVLDAGLIRAEAEIGNRMSLSALPTVLGQLVIAWNQGEIATADPDNDNFRRLFSKLADQAAA